MKILIVDIRNFYRQAFISVLEKIKSLKIVGETDNILNCLKLCKKCLPDIVVVGEVNSSLVSKNITLHIKKYFPKIKVLILASEEKQALLDDFLSGADGYISDKWTFNELKNALNYFQKDGVLIPRKMALRLVKELKEKSMFPQPSFTPAEIEILKLLAQGKMNKEIASVLGKSEKAIKNYLHIIFIKLGVSRRSEAIAKVYSQLKVL